MVQRSLLHVGPSFVPPMRLSVVGAHEVFISHTFLKSALHLVDPGGLGVDSLLLHQLDLVLDA
jgi:hypothetical protein